MNLADYFLGLALNYERAGGLRTSAQEMLTQAPALLAEHLPAGMVLLGSGGKGQATYTPWVGWFDPDETVSPQRGIYVVYILSEDMERLTLSLNQGIESLRSRHGDSKARTILSLDAAAIRTELPEEAASWFSDTIDLRSRGARQVAYQAGNIACRMYDTGSLPQEIELRADLSRMLRLYELAIEAKRELLIKQPGAVASPGQLKGQPFDDPLSGFKPKSDADYRSI